MKRIVDGVEVEFTDSPEATIERLSDRLIVRTPEGARTAVAIRSGEQTLVSYKGRQYAVGGKTSRARQSTAGSGEIKAPMPGLIVDVFVAEGDEVKKGQRLLVLEAMKTQQPFSAPFDGVVRALGAIKGAQVAEGALLARVEAPK